MINAFKFAHSSVNKLTQETPDWLQRISPCPNAFLRHAASEDVGQVSSSAQPLVQSREIIAVVIHRLSCVRLRP